MAPAGSPSTRNGTNSANRSSAACAVGTCRAPTASSGSANPATWSPSRLADWPAHSRPKSPRADRVGPASAGAGRRMTSLDTARSSGAGPPKAGGFRTWRCGGENMAVLEVTGLAGREERAYRALLKLPAATAAELADRLGASADEMHAVLRALEARGMVSLTPGSPPRYRAAPPDLAFGPLLRRREEEIARIRALVSDLADEYRSRVALRGAGELVEVVYGQRAIAQRMEQLQRTARREVRGLVKQPVIAVSAAENVTENAVIADGVRYRVLYDRELLELPGDPFRIALSARNGEESRIGADLPLKLAIADDALAIVPVA